MASRSTSQAPEAAHTSNNSSRERRKKESRSESRKPSTRAKPSPEERGAQIMLDYASLHNGLELEQPDDADFTGTSRLARLGYYLRLRQLRAEMKKGDKQPAPESSKAPAPSVPNPLDDGYPTRPFWVGEEDGDEEWSHEPCRPKKRRHNRATASSKRPRFHGKFSHLSREFVLPEDESEEEELPEHIIRKTPPTFLGIPREIRMEIYRYLLTVKKPIAVHGGWKQVYWTKDLQLSTGILRVCKVVYEEACMVLYGANTFLYRLRDPASIAWDNDNLAMDDSSLYEDETESDSDYYDSDYEVEDDDEDEGDKVDKESSINIEKYAALFRNISIEAEANRYSKVTQDSMVAAINVFCKKDEESSGEQDKGESEEQDKGEPEEQNKGASREQGEGRSEEQNRGKFVKPSCNIHTMTLRVMPLWDRQHVNAAQGRFTFVDFFHPDGPVIEAIKSVDCQMLHVDILTRHTSRQSAHAPVTMRGSGSCRLTINRRHEQAFEHFQRDARLGISVGDKAIRRRTEEMAKRSAMAIHTLAEHIQKQCAQRNFHQETTMDMDVDSLDWLEWGDLDVIDGIGDMQFSL
ncbi:hypothetical protein V8C42DRAFT_362432 [Trichoderma barbatum]